MNKFIKKLLQTNLLQSKKNIAILGAVIAMLPALLLPVVTQAQQSGNFLTGNIVTATNNTTDATGTWGDPVNATSGQIIEFKVVAQNQTQGMTAKNVNIHAGIPVEQVNDPKVTGFVTADNFNQASDTATVHLTDGRQQGLVFVNGHTRIFGTSSAINCPSGCPLPDAFAADGINIGDLEFGQSVQILFKAGLTNVPGPTTAPTAQPTQVPTQAPTTAPTVAPTAVPTASAPANNVQCPAGTIFSRIEGNQIVCINNVNNNSNTNNNNQTVNVTVPSSSPGEVRVLAAGKTSVKELPKTGLPLAGLALAGLTPIGMKLRKSGKGLESLTPNFMWEKREFDREA